MANIKRATVELDSSLLQALRFDYRSGTMVTWFKDGTVYEYDNVSVDEFTAICTAESAGRKFLETVKNRPYLKY